MPLDPRSPDWLIVRDFCSKEIEKARDQLESPSLDQINTNATRGMVLAYRNVLRLEEERAKRD